MREQMTKRGSGKVGSRTLTHEFSSWEEMLKSADRPLTEAMESTGRKRSSRRSGLSKWTKWTLTSTWEEALHLARTGWYEKTKEVAHKKRALVNRVSKQVPKSAIGHAISNGFHFDIGRVVTGDPKHWMVFEEDDTRDGRGEKLRKITFNAGYSWKTDAEVIVTKGIMIASLIELLEYAGYAVDFTISIAFTRYNQLYQFLAPVKTYGQPILLSRLLFATAHPAMLRRIAFAVCESELDRWWLDKIGIGRGYGHVSPLERKYHGDLYIDSGAITKESLTSAGQEKWLINQLKRQGVRLI